jgi:hypothetical protein
VFIPGITESVYLVYIRGKSGISIPEQVFDPVHPDGDIYLSPLYHFITNLNIHIYRTNFDLPFFSGDDLRTMHRFIADTLVAGEETPVIHFSGEDRIRDPHGKGRTNQEIPGGIQKVMSASLAGGERNTGHGTDNIVSRT